MRLTPRTLQIAKLVIEGMTAAEMADALHISPRTVKQLKCHMYKQIGAQICGQPRVRLAIYLYQNRHLLEEVPTSLPLKRLVIADSASGSYTSADLSTSLIPIGK